MSDTYRDVDGSGHVQLAVDWQEALARWPAIRAYKERTWSALADADRIVDVGAGPGDDVLALGVERCVAVDRSAAMCDRAAARGAVAVRAAAEALPFARATFAGARADRTFQHLDDPALAVQELVRVVAPGGVVVLADPDQASLVIEVPGVRPSVLRRLQALRRDVGYRNGTWISSAPRVLDRSAAEVVAVERFPVVIESMDDAFGLAGWPTIWRELGAFSDDELLEWDAVVRAQAPGFSYRFEVVVVIARVRDR